MTTEFQARSSRSGREFEELCVQYLKVIGWTVTETKAIHHNVEIDIVARDRAGNEVWIECKGGYSDGGRDGAARTDSTPKFLGALRILDWVAPDHPPYILLSSALPTSGRAHAWLEVARAHGIRIEVLPMIENTSREGGNL